jgi:hypothetical protein
MSAPAKANTVPHSWRTMCVEYKGAHKPWWYAGLCQDGKGAGTWSPGPVVAIVEDCFPGGKKKNHRYGKWEFKKYGKYEKHDKYDKHGKKGPPEFKFAGKFKFDKHDRHPGVKLGDNFFPKFDKGKGKGPIGLLPGGDMWKHGGRDFKFGGKKDGPILALLGEGGKNRGKPFSPGGKGFGFGNDGPEHHGMRPPSFGGLPSLIGGKDGANCGFGPLKGAFDKHGDRPDWKGNDQRGKGPVVGFNPGSNPGFGGKDGPQSHGPKFKDPGGDTFQHHDGPPPPPPPATP